MEAKLLRPSFHPTNLLIHLFGWRGAILHGDPAVWSRYRWLKKHLLPGLTTLDAGCGSGAFTLFADSIGNNATGYSHDSANNHKARIRASIVGSTAQFLTVDLRHIEDRPERFDQIICLECIEHILDDQKLVDSLARMLNPGGRLLLTTPYKHHKPYFREWATQSTEEDGGHVRFGYTHEEIRSLFNNAWLDVIVEDFHVGFVTIQIANLYLIIGHYLHPYLAWLLTFPLRIFQPLDHLVTRLLRYPYVSIGTVGIKR
jgi:cyclopropane fatty-acyl-phospholipid synthase-like methyltransferase